MTKADQHGNSNSSIDRRVASAALTLAVVLGLGVVSTHSAQAQTYQAPTYKETVLYSFTGGRRGGSSRKRGYGREGKPLWHHLRRRR
jgi:hypothetical protein